MMEENTARTKMENNGVGERHRGHMGHNQGTRAYMALAGYYIVQRDFDSSESESTAEQRKNKGKITKSEGILSL